MAEIALTRGRVAIVDDDDLHLIIGYAWHLDPGIRSIHGYAKSVSGRKTIYMHRLILGAVRGQIVDHINRNSLDNRRCNLRFATTCQSARNATKPSNKNGFRGIEATERVPERYRAIITVERRVIRGPKRRTPVEAAIDYDHLAIKHHLSFAVLNFPHDEAAS